MILLTGGSGLLGTELQKHMEFYAPSSVELDITRIINLSMLPELIVHCAAYTDVNRAEEECEKCYDTNVFGTWNICYLGIPVLFISTDSIFDGSKGNYTEHDIPNPINYYSRCKHLAEQEVLMKHGKVIRTSFKARPWRSDYAFSDQFTSADYVDVIAPMIIEAINMYNDLPRIVHIGTHRKSHYDLAIQTHPDVKEISIYDIPVKRAYDTSLDCSLWRSLVHV